MDQDLANTFHWCPKVISSLWDSTPELAGSRSPPFSSARREVTFFSLTETTMFIDSNFRWPPSVTETTPPKHRNKRCFGHSAVTTWHGFVHCRGKIADTDSWPKQLDRINAHRICLLSFLLWQIIFHYFPYYFPLWHDVCARIMGLWRKQSFTHEQRNDW